MTNANEAAIEAEIKSKGKTAPRITPAMIDDKISERAFLRHGVLTICILTLWNGFTVTGESACASPENYDEEIGQKIAFENARQKIWPLEGYLLKSMAELNRLQGV